MKQQPAASGYTAHSCRGGWWQAAEVAGLNVGEDGVGHNEREKARTRVNADNWGTALGSGRYAVQGGGILPTSQGRRDAAGRAQQLSGARAPQRHLLGGRLSRWPQPPRRRPMPRCWCGGGDGCAPRRRRRWMTCGCARTTERRHTETPPATVEESSHRRAVSWLQRRGRTRLEGACIARFTRLLFNAIHCLQGNTAHKHRGTRC